MSTLSAGAVLHAKYSARQYQRTVDDTSIELTVGKPANNTSIELPAEIKALITGSDYWVQAKTNRYKKLIREGHLATLLQLAHDAHTKEHPANWFAAACSKARWDKYTLPYIAKLKMVARKAEAVARRIGTNVSTFIYKQIWKGVNVERWAIAAQEIKHDKPGQSKLKHFAWLCLHEQRMTK